MKVKADRVLIKRVVTDAITSGGIIFTHTGEEKTHKGTVVAVGPGRTSSEDVVIPMDLKEGDTVIYDVKKGIPIKLHGDDLIVLKEEDVFAVIEE